MREIDNYRPDLEALASELVASIGHDSSGALTHREVAMMAQRFGLEIVHVGDLPRSARSVTDLENGRIYLPPASIPGGHGLRSLALQAIAHQVLQHRVPAGYEEFLQQRLEINYFAAACLMPRDPRPRVSLASKEGKEPGRRGLPRCLRCHARGSGLAVYELGDRSPGPAAALFARRR